MQKIAKFEKVSHNQFLTDWEDTFLSPASEEIYDSLELPARATRGSAGYDFYLPCDLQLAAGETAKIPTGIRVKIATGWVLLLFPRSSLGFRYRLQLDNTVGVIDSDYYSADNEGHIFIKITNDNLQNRPLELKAGQAFAQGVFLPFGITEDDHATEKRTGGLGSTS